MGMSEFTTNLINRLIDEYYPNDSIFIPILGIFVYNFLYYSSRVFRERGLIVTDSNENIPIEKKREIFHDELKILREKRLIPKSDYIRLSSAYERYYHQMLQQTAFMEKQKKKDEMIQSSAIPNEVSHNIQQTKEHAPKSIQDPVQTPMASPEPRMVIQQHPVVKSVKSAEQIRERNITLVLVMGVILLLFGGLILATSTWGALNAVLKVFCISMVAVFFCGMAFIAFKLKIKQTAFAFLTLASLFIPITILSASYYQIFGEYLSLQGEGRGLLGLIGGAICLGIYFVIAKHFASKLFTILSLLTFALAAFSASLMWRLLQKHYLFYSCCLIYYFYCIWIV